MAFHHGVETKRVDGGTIPVLTTDTAITGVIIASETGKEFELTRCVLNKDFDQFGQNDTLDILKRYSAGTHYVVNIGKAEFEEAEEAEENATPDTADEADTTGENETSSEPEANESETAEDEPEEAPQPAQPEFKSAEFDLQGDKKDEIILPDKSLKDLKVYFKESLVDPAKYTFDKKTGKIKFNESLLPPAVTFDQLIQVVDKKTLFIPNPAHPDKKGKKKYKISAPKGLALKGFWLKKGNQQYAEYNDTYSSYNVRFEKLETVLTSPFPVLIKKSEDFNSIEFEFAEELTEATEIFWAYEKSINAVVDLKYEDDGSNVTQNDRWYYSFDYRSVVPKAKNLRLYQFNSNSNSVYRTILYNSTNNNNQAFYCGFKPYALYYYGEYVQQTKLNKSVSGDSPGKATLEFYLKTQEKDLNKALGITPPEIEALKVEYTTVIEKQEKPEKPKEDKPSKPSKTPEELAKEKLEKDKAIKKILGELPKKDTTNKKAPALTAETTAKVLLAIQELKQGYIKFGTDAKVILAPSFDQDPAVASALLDMAEQIKARAYIDVDGTSLSDVLEKRGKNAGNLQLSSERALYFFPKAKGANGKDESLATHAAGLRMLTDVEKGYWHSSSNQNLKGVVGTTVNLYARPDDIRSETNALNAVGINTVFNSYGTGFRLWGNRSSSYPTITHIKNFEVALAVGDFIDENIKRVELQYVDRPINQAVVDSLVFSIDTFMRTLPSIAGYKVGLNYKYDLVDAFSRGQIPIMYEYTPILPAERISNESIMTREYLINLIKKD